MIDVILSRDELHKVRSKLERVALVPTMGNLHDGHMSLIESALESYREVFVSIFVNPKQFGPNEDFEKYPRTLEEDIKKITNLLESSSHYSESKVYIFAPSSILEIYPKDFNTTITIKDVTSKLCGAQRPGHFDGVATVVYQLFALINPEAAYFGQKDFQQCLVIKKLVKDLRLPVLIKTIATKRDIDGLALSSRNQYLSDEQRKEALSLPSKISQIADILKTQPWLEAQGEINEILEEVIKDKRFQYFEILDSENLKNVNDKTKEVLIAGAFISGTTRLIDNETVEIKYAR